MNMEFQDVNDGRTRKVVFNRHVLINGERHEVWVRAESHDLGKNNNTDPHVWVKMKDCWIPWLDRREYSVKWGVNVTTDNYTKEKWNHTNINLTGKCVITCNGIEVFSFGCIDIMYALNKAQYLIYQFQEHAFDFSEPMSNDGMRVWYFDQPAIVKVNLGQLKDGEITLVYDGEGAFNLTKHLEWAHEKYPDLKEDDCGFSSEEWNGRKEIRDSILSTHIKWYRK